MGRRSISKGRILGPPLTTLSLLCAFSLMPVTNVDAATAYSCKLANENIQGKPVAGIPILYVNGTPYVSISKAQTMIASKYGIDVHWDGKNISVTPETSQPSKPNFSVGTGNTSVYVNGKQIKKFNRVVYKGTGNSAETSYIPLATLSQVLHTAGVSSTWSNSGNGTLSLAGVLAYVPVGRGTITYTTSDHGQWSMSFLPHRPSWNNIEPSSKWVERLVGGTWIKEYNPSSDGYSSYIFQNQRELVSYTNGVAVLLAQVHNKPGDTWTTNEGSYHSTMTVISNNLNKTFPATSARPTSICYHGLALKYEDPYQTETTVLQPGFGTIASYGGGKVSDATPEYSPMKLSVQY